MTKLYQHFTLDEEFAAKNRKNIKPQAAQILKDELKKKGYKFLEGTIIIEGIAKDVLMSKEFNENPEKSLEFYNIRYTAKEDFENAARSLGLIYKPEDSYMQK